ncbi:MAG: FtsQ-type POTRA domain-containing protein [Microbacterium sp.]|uniref:FtsQ-type POTRA domain-containing protein n=1 Tax=Microbacterium sp. TaxID=51671 RepID=UPI0039E43C25
MRRPTPLPPPPRPAGAPPVDPQPATRPREEAPADLADAGQVTQPLAPLIPLPAQTPQPASEPDAPADTPVRLRDLWRAQRARRKALRAEVRRFTGRARRRRRIWLGVAASLVLLVAVTVGAAYSPLFAVDDIEVVGTSQLDPQSVQDALSGQLGTPLAAIDESAVKAALIAFPLVESYTLEADPPHTLVVRIVERTPVGVVQSDAGFTLYDAAGVALSTTADQPTGYPLMTVTGGVDSDAFTAAGQVMRALPSDVRARVTAVTASTPDDVTLTIDGKQVVWGSADQSATKALVLQEIMAARPDVSSYDVSTPDAVVVR